MRALCPRFSARGRAPLVALIVTAAFGAASVQAPLGSAAATAGAAKVCSSGYAHAVIGGSQKCLRRGEFCAHRYRSQYRRYGYSCTRVDARGNYHLT